MITTILNGLVLDSERMEWLGERHLTVEDDRIVEVETTRPTHKADRVIDAHGRFVLPGFIDAHVHHVITTMDFRRLARMTAFERALGMAQLAKAALHRGFTTVRDTGGETTGLIRAIASGLCEGPRIVPSGRALSQTGGHGDVQPSEGAICACQIHSTDFAHVADGPDAVRLAARNELRAGASFIKIMTSGGVASPTDPFDSVQYTGEEIRAATTETDHRHTYTTSHAYQPEAILLAIENGVRCIEHGNLIDETTAKRMSELGVAMVPTLVTYKAMAEIGEKLGLPAINVSKNSGVFEAGLRSIEIASAAGVELGLGSDLLGEAQTWQNHELSIRADVQPIRDVLHSLFRVNAGLCGLEDQIGMLRVGYAADLILTRVDALECLREFARPEDAIDGVLARGKLVVDRLG